MQYTLSNFPNKVGGEGRGEGCLPAPSSNIGISALVQVWFCHQISYKIWGFSKIFGIQVCGYGLMNMCVWFVQFDQSGRIFFNFVLN